MSYDYSALAKTAKRLIEKFGKSVTVRRMTDSGVPWAPTQIVADTSFKGVLTNYMADEIDGTLIAATDRKLLLAGHDAAVAPVVSDKIVMGGNELEIVSIKTLEPGDLTLLWTVQVRA